MKLLFDQNLSPRLVNRLLDVYPNSAHVNALELGTAKDRSVWEYALQHDYVLVSKDSDFSDLGILLGFPPKVIWIRRGNCSTNEIEQILRQNKVIIEDFNKNQEKGIIVLF